MIPSVEVTLDGLDGLDNTVQLLIPGEDDEGAVDAGRAGVGLEAAGDEDLVVVLTDFPVLQKAKLSAGLAWETDGRKDEIASSRLTIWCRTRT